MGRKWIFGGLGGVVCLFFVLTLAGSAIKASHGNRIAPGIMLGGMDLSGLTPAQAEALLTENLPKVQLELVCLLLPELGEEVELQVRQFERNALREDSRGKAGEEKHGGQTGFTVEVKENKLHLKTEETMVSILTEETMENVYARSKEVKVWEWLYAEVFGKPFCNRSAAPEFAWREQYFSELLGICAELLDREAKSATLAWENGEIFVTGEQRGYAVNKPATSAEAERVFAEAVETLENRWADGVSIQLFVSGGITVPRLTAETAKKCDTKIAEYTTGYAGAGEGRAQNIAAGAAHLHGKVILPGEEFSTAKALSPFTSENGYAVGGTYINGQLSESIGGGVCQLSTTLYNALLRTRLDITKRYPHSLSVGYIPLGQDAAIAGDYKDLCFINSTDAPVLLLCEVTGEEVKVTLYGTTEAVRGNVTMESIVTEETEEGVTVEVYRTEQAEGGAAVRELISVNRYGKVEW